MEISNPGLGFWQIAKEDAKRVFIEGYEIGYRHFDTAVAYRNESEIGEAIKELNLDRDAYWITSKIPAEIKNHDDAKRVIEESLNRLGLEYLDLMLIHAPKPWPLMFAPGPRFHKGNLEVWKALVEAKREGKIKNIGVSNFNVNDLKNIMDNSDEPIFANQIRVHIGHVPTKIIDFCKENNILVEAYSPIGTGRLIDNETVKEIAKKNGVSPAKLCIKYTDALGTLPLPRSRSKEHMKENFEFDFALSKEDMEILDKVSTL